MGSSNIEVYIHYIWHTEDRRDLLRGPLERYVHRQIIDIAEDHGVEPLAVNSAWTHTHVLVRWNATSTISDLAEDWKTTTSTDWEPRPDAPRELSWQTGYGSYSIRKTVPTASPKTTSPAWSDTSAARNALTERTR